MSAPLVPSKTCCSNLEDDHNQSKNNNESKVSTGDTNANQIVMHMRTLEDEDKQYDDVDPMENMYFGGSENFKQSGKEPIKLRVCSKESPVFDMSLQDCSHQHPINRTSSEDHMTDDAKDMLNTTPACHRQLQFRSQNNINDISLDFPVSGRRETIQKFFKDNLGKTVETEESKSMTLGGYSNLSAGTESFTTEYIGSLLFKDLPSSSLDSSDVSCCAVGSTEKSQKTLTDQFLALAYHSLDSTSEEKKTVSKPTTSEMKKTNILECQSILGTTLNFNKQSTWHPTFTDHQNSAGKPQEASTVSEAHLAQGGICRKLEMPHIQSLQQTSESVTPVDLLGCQKKGSILSQAEERWGRDTSQCQLQDTCNKGEVPLLNQAGAQTADRLMSGSMCPAFSSDSHDSSNRAGHLIREEYVVANKDQRPQFPITAAPDNEKFSGKLLPNRNRSMDEAVSAGFQAGSAHTSFVHTVHPPGEKSLKAVENMHTIFEGELLRNTICALNNQNKDSVSAEHLSYPDSENNFLTASSEPLVEGSASSFQNRQTATVEKQHPGEAKDSWKASESTHSFLHVPDHSCPVAASSVSNQSLRSDCSLKDLFALHSHGLLPSPVLPPTESTQALNVSPKAPIKTACNSGIPKPILVHSKPCPTDREEAECSYSEMSEEKTETKPIAPKPKHVRPKIITYIRRNPQAIGRLDMPLETSGLPFGPSACHVPVQTEARALSGDHKSSNLFYDKFKPDLPNPRLYSSGLMVSGIRPPVHQFTQMNEKFLQEVGERPGKEEFCPPPYTPYEVPPSFYRSTMILKPQLGLGAISRLPSTKSRILIASQRSSASCLHPQGPVTATTSLYQPDASVDLKKGSIPNATKSNLPKPYQSGLRPPGYARLPTAKLAAFGFVRSSSVSSISSNQSNDSGQSDVHKTSNRSSFASEDQSTQKAAVPSRDIPKGASRTVQQAANTVTSRRSLLPAPKTTTTPAAVKREALKDQEASKPALSSPKRLVVSAPKLHSPGHPKLRPSTQRNGFSTKPDLQTREAERQLLQQLKEKCEEQAKKLLLVQKELKRANQGFKVFAVATQHFFKKSETGRIKEKELSAELANIRDEIAFNTTRHEKLQKEKEILERRFEDEVRKLQYLQNTELQALEKRLQQQYSAEVERMHEEQNFQLLEIKSQHQEQVEGLTIAHEAVVLQMENCHTVAIAVLEDEHNNKIQDLQSNHELEQKMLEDEFEKLRLSLQDQVDTLTFQNQCLRDRANRFEEALKKSTDEQLELALAPYQHLEEDMNSLKHVLEMKNQQIHQQEKKIMDLEKLAEINIILEEKIQVLQQQNEDLKARIDQNTAVTRQLSEDNANLQESVEKETKEKKRLSRTNEELLWKLQTAEPMSPVRLSPSSPIYHSASGSLSPSKVNTASR
ncbi:microtubule-associated tumor suppressor candidate 2 [Microcaecilia unicolor]|uniref:Microtubule-associated tumor suppressor candidate 2 n=1 Tax=Microcaecilia unicolor TaxID=1415580 RepID=A0A6P7Y572_9AMPH|nr:microtubule-associated tumor suppressor candidate 2 [Microcaecilia unicolor]